VKNLFDARGQIGMSGTRITNIGPNTGQIDQSISYIPPRQYGVEVQYRF
jgi:iron complex outermembrane receptor protein